MTAREAKGLDGYVGETISVITNDGRNIVGVLQGFDQSTNIVLTDCHERVYSTDAPVEQEVLGLYLIRGDNIAVIGEVEEILDSQIDFNAVRAEPLKPVVH
jgi:U6 snRNA-associated Sm-like protein LSm8